MFMKLLLLTVLFCTPILAEEEQPPAPAPAKPVFQVLKPQEPYIVNAGAQVEVIMFPNSEFLNFLGHAGPGETILGLYIPKTDGSHDILIVGSYSLPMMVFVHEYQHLLEDMLPDQAARLRRVFHMLRSPDFEIGAGDLADHLPGEDAEPAAPVGEKPADPCHK